MSILGKAGSLPTHLRLFRAYSCSENSAEIRNFLAKIVIYIYIYRRFMRFFPYVFAAYTLTFFVQYVYLSPLPEAEELESLLLNGLSEISVIDIYMLAYGRWPLNSPAWAISIMFLVECVIYCCYSYSKRLFKCLIFPISFVLACTIYAGRNLFVSGNNYFQLEICRIWIDVCLGGVCFHLSYKIREIFVNKTARIVITAIEIICHLLFLLLANCNTPLTSYWIGVSISIPIVSIAYSCRSYLENLLERIKITPFLADLSLGVYLTHRSILMCYSNKYPAPYEMYAHKFNFLTAVFTVAFLYIVLMKIILKCGSRCCYFLTGPRQSRQI